MQKVKILFFFFLTMQLSADKVEITSDAMKAEETSKEVHFIGNVTVKQLKSWIHGDKVIVYFDENNQTKAYEAVGAVTFEFNKERRFYKGNANKVVYAPLRSTYTLSGNAVIEDVTNKRHINGDFITLDLDSGMAQVRGDKKKPVKFIFEAEEKK